MQLTPVISALERLRQKDVASLRPAWATQEIPGKCVKKKKKKKKKSLGSIMFYLDPHIHWQQILTLNTAHRPRWFPKNVDSPQEWVES